MPTDDDVTDAITESYVPTLSDALPDAATLARLWILGRGFFRDGDPRTPRPVRFPLPAVADGDGS